MEKIFKILKAFFLTALLLLAALSIFVTLFIQFGIYHPKPVEEMEIHTVANAKPGEPIKDSLKVLSYNIQYLAGKDYVFFYDLPGFSGPDIRPSSESIAETLDNIAALIKSENPDVVLLQEVDEGASRTDKANQTELILSKLGDLYPYYSEAFYWKAVYVPHPKINGSVGMKLTTLSKAPIVKSIRHQLPRIGGDPISRQFNFCRAVLECHIQSETGTLAVLNTHLDAFPDNPETMVKQVNTVDTLLNSLDEQNIPWVIGGDFNLLPPGFAEHFNQTGEEAYSKASELTPLFEKYRVFPSLDQAFSPDSNKYFTHYPNNPSVSAPDKIIDYLFYSKELSIESSEVMQGKTWSYSDHLSLKASFRIQQ